jgi:hypothetical protein
MKKLSLLLLCVLAIQTTSAQNEQDFIRKNELLETMLGANGFLDSVSIYG